MKIKMIKILVMSISVLYFIGCASEINPKIENTENNESNTQAEVTENKIETTKKEKICKQVKYQNESYLQHLELTVYSGRIVQLAQQRKFFLDVNLDNKFIKNDCKSTAENKNIAFGFFLDKNDPSLCICAFGDTKDEK